MENWVASMCGANGMERRRIQFAAHSREELREQIRHFYDNARILERLIVFETLYVADRDWPVMIDGSTGELNFEPLMRRPHVTEIHVALRGDR